MANTYDGQVVFFDVQGAATPTNYVDTDGPHATEAGAKNGDLLVRTIKVENRSAAAVTVSLRAQDHLGNNDRLIWQRELPVDERLSEDLNIALQRAYTAGTAAGANGVFVWLILK